MVRLFPLEGIDEFRISESVVSTIYRPPFRIQPLGLIFNVFRFFAPVGVFSEWFNVFSGVGGVSGFWYPFHHLSPGYSHGDWSILLVFKLFSPTSLPLKLGGPRAMESLSTVYKSFTQKIWGDALMIVTIICLVVFLASTAPLLAVYAIISIL